MNRVHQVAEVDRLGQVFLKSHRQGFRAVRIGGVCAHRPLPPYLSHRDRAIIENVPRSETSLEWFQLSRFDGPLVATRKPMERHYAPTRDDLRVTCDLEPVGVGSAVARDARV